MDSTQTKDGRASRINFPISITEDNTISTVTQYEDMIRQSIRIILQTSKGERVMRSGFGTSLKDYIFYPLNPTTEALIKNEIKDALTRFEPRIDVLSIDVTSSRDQQSIMEISMKYRIIETGAIEDLKHELNINNVGG